MTILEREEKSIKKEGEGAGLRRDRGLERVAMEIEGKGSGG